VIPRSFLIMRLAAWLCLVAFGCSAPDLSRTYFSCKTDSDCLAGKVCGLHNLQPACVDPSQDPIRLGMSGPLKGPSENLGTEMARGIRAQFEAVNRAGGIFGRRLELDPRNDSYDPAQAIENTKSLLDIRNSVDDPDKPDERGANSVLALIGNVGTPTMLATAPIATKNHVVFFAPFTGAQAYLRDDTNSPYVFNYRASYYQETEAMVDYMKDNRNPRIITGNDSYRRILVFAQRDSYGDSGYAGLVNAYNRRVAPLPQPDPAQPSPSIAVIRYERENLPSVDPAVTAASAFLQDVLDTASNEQDLNSVAIVMVDTYQPGNKFIRGVKDWLNGSIDRATRLDVAFMHVSFVGSDSLAQALSAVPESYVDVTDPTGMRRKYYADGVLVTQVVPSYESKAPGVTQYRQDLKAYEDRATSFTSLEGYVAARLFVEALRQNGPTFTGDSLVKTLETKLTDLDIGIGTRLGFSSVDHQASDTVWGSILDAGAQFRVPFSWNPIDRIVVESN
ncbi:MAG TPA: ABC transporter substrate-binding protein, partial [Polyangiaceae bacterium]|nr:ABC transporter substrate-binding protein [Polyangiaceae bacterium]